MKASSSLPSLRTMLHSEKTVPKTSLALSPRESRTGGADTAGSSLGPWLPSPPPPSKPGEVEVVVVGGRGGGGSCCDAESRPGSGPESGRRCSACGIHCLV